MSDPIRLPENMTPEQAAIVNKALAAITRLQGFRDTAKAEHLPVLADFLNEACNIIDIGLRKQIAGYSHPQAGLFA